MKKSAIAFFILLATCSVGWSQGGGDSQNPDQKAPQQRPTLGPPSGQAEGGPQTSQTIDPRKLAHVHAIFVDQMDNGLNEMLIEGLGKLGRFRIVDDRSQADGILSGSCFDSAHMKVVHSEVFLSDRLSGKSIWQDNIHEHYMPPPLNRAVEDTAALIVQHLVASIAEAERR